MPSNSRFVIYCSLLMVLALAQAQSPTRTIPALVTFEPRDFTFCAGAFFLISDAYPGKINELDSYGRLQSTWALEEGGLLRGIACDDARQWLHVATSNYQSIISLVLPTEEDRQDNEFLVVAQHVELDLPPHEVTSELGGFTWDPVVEEFVVVQPGSPSVLLSFSQTGELNRLSRVLTREPVSRVAFDGLLNALWLLSEENSTLYQTDISGASVYQEWSLPADHYFCGLSFESNDAPTLYLITVPTREQAVSVIYEYDQMALLPSVSIEAVSPSYSTGQWAIILGGVFGVVFLSVLLLSCIVAFFVGARWKKNVVLQEYDLHPMIRPDEGNALENEAYIDAALLAV